MRASEIYESIGSVADIIIASANEIINDRVGSDIYLLTKYDNRRVWTRGDGSRYKDPSTIKVDVNVWKNYRDTITPHFVNDNAVLRNAWNLIKEQGTHEGTIKGQLGDSEYNDAYKVRGVLFIDRGDSIQFGSASLLRNLFVWQKKAP